MVSPGCTNCYAQAMNKRLGNKRDFTGDWNFVLNENELHNLLRSKEISGKRVFIGGMCDLFHKDVPFETLDRLFAVFALRPDVTWQVLTKRPHRMAEYTRDLERTREIADAAASIVPLGFMPKCDIDANWGCMPWPLPGVWLGTSVEDQQRANERIPWLLKCPAAVRFISCEPLLGAVDLERPNWIGSKPSDPLISPEGVRGASWLDDFIDWVIVGGEWGHNARPCNVDHVRSVVKQCQAAEVPVFVNQLGKRIIIANDSCSEWPNDGDGLLIPYGGSVSRYQGERIELRLQNSKGGDPAEWPADIRIREFPNCN